jgi:TRAP-type C4-dicarboxylate transport system permease large subunit
VFKNYKTGGKIFNLQILHECMINSAKTTGMILFIIVCANILNSYIEYAGITHSISAWVKGLGWSFHQLIFGLIVLYAILGMFLDALSVQIATTPIIAPIVIAAGADFVGINTPEVLEYYAVWFGIFLIVMCELGMITPPMGLNLFIINGIRKDSGSIKDTVIGAIPFAIIMIFFVSLLIVFPQIAMYLTGLKI